MEYGQNELGKTETEIPNGQNQHTKWTNSNWKINLKFGQDQLGKLAK